MKVECTIVSFVMCVAFRLLAFELAIRSDSVELCHLESWQCFRRLCHKSALLHRGKPMHCCTSRALSQAVALLSCVENSHADYSKCSVSFVVQR